MPAVHRAPFAAGCHLQRDISFSISPRQVSDGVVDGSPYAAADLSSIRFQTGLFLPAQIRETLQVSIVPAIHGRFSAANAQHAVPFPQATKISHPGVDHAGISRSLPYSPMPHRRIYRSTRAGVASHKLLEFRIRTPSLRPITMGLNTAVYQSIRISAKTHRGSSSGNE
ncbi:uncharacterized protein LAESUDRAFT_723812 [Laetiporus sulphureus 93-53]|uniref:Uncharacterized protein n=1 Tax=Laetiporus sulphureus 93-53 TaxID=1314785 RepID=A0A165F3S9_9APHY|nr:uncharacterized protein LAESUDRAFT_723812 [Laetiporus sulphureus 93-53]KZT08323.1 hypothetical protein LAESUDRAFT_723812 [Laetiporus sulphureus 93-53]